MNTFNKYNYDLCICLSLIDNQKTLNTIYNIIIIFLVTFCTLCLFTEGTRWFL